jgi:hypothetical protein
VAKRTHKDLASRIAAFLSSAPLNTVVGLAGVAIPVAAWISTSTALKNTLLGVETALVIGMAANQIWLRSIYLHLRRANSRQMADGRYFELVRNRLESDLLADYDQITDGHLQVYASEVPRVSVLLLRALIESDCTPRRVLAMDLTTDPQLLTGRHDYITTNRRLIETGGSIQRIFTCWSHDLEKSQFAAALLPLVEHHRSLGVQCGLAVRERLPADHAIDFVVVANGAVLVEEEQGNAEYTRGRSSVYFKNIARWENRFETVWGTPNTPTAMLRMQAYETTARPMLGTMWEADRIAPALRAVA